MNIEFDINSYLRLNIVDMLIICISTFLIVVIAKKFFWNKVNVYLQQRQRAIQQDIDEAMNQKEEATRLKQQYDEQLAQAKQTVNGIIEDAKSMVAQERKEILVKAKQEAQAMKEKASADIESEKRQVRKEIKEQISEVAFLAAQKIVEKELDEEKHKEYVDTFIEQAGDSSWQA